MGLTPNLGKKIGFRAEIKVVLEMAGQVGDEQQSRGSLYRNKGPSVDPTVYGRAL